jgi:hypothetical protein
MWTCPRCGGLTPSEASRTCLHCDAIRPPRWALKLTALLGPAGAILLAACYGAPGHYGAPVRGPQDGPDGTTRVDRDGDHAFGPWECAPYAPPSCAQQLPQMAAPPDVDCADDDPTRYPGAVDDLGDQIDQNCDGADGAAGDPAHVVIPPPS